jgi:hypothetical protein
MIYKTEQNRLPRAMHMPKNICRMTTIAAYEWHNSQKVSSFNQNTYDSETKLIKKTMQLLALINEPTLKTIRPFLGSAHFIIGNPITDVR